MTGTGPLAGKTGLFVTCLANLLHPGIGVALANLVRRTGVEPVVPPAQTCCGQPAYNSGDRRLAVRMAAKTARDFSGCGRVVVPSGSCASMVRLHYRQLADDAGNDRNAIIETSEKFMEASQFLSDAGVAFERREGLKPITYHDCCAGLRELGIGSEPRRMLREKGYDIVEMDESDVCCGFGGTFSVKFPEISASMADDRCDCALATGTDTLVMGDLGCMLNIEGRLAARNGHGVRLLHLVEALDA